jgi:hypothetical protein
VAAGGEITAIDSAGFDPVTITKSITITSPPGVEAGIAANAGGNAITINAGSSGVVALHGLTLEGGGTDGNQGISFNSGASLDIIGCVVRDYLVAGINIFPSGGAQVTIANSYISNNNSVGINLSSGSGTLYVTIDYDVITDNPVAINAYGSTAAIDITIANSDISHSATFGLDTASNAGVPVSANLVNVVFNDTAGNGIYAQSDTTVTLSHVNDDHDAGGLLINGGAIDSDGNNHLPSVLGGSLGSYTQK